MLENANPSSPMNHAASSPLTARRAGALKGRARVPGDKSISHRAMIFGALTVGETRISGLLEGEDVLNTANAMRALGAHLERTGEGAWRVHGVCVGGFPAPDRVLDVANAGTGCRLVMGAVAEKAGVGMESRACAGAACNDSASGLGASAQARPAPATVGGSRSRLPARVIQSRSSIARRFPRRRSSQRYCSPVSPRRAKRP